MQIATFCEERNRLVLNWTPILGIFLLIGVLDLLNNEAQLALSIPLQIRTILVLGLGILNLGLILVDTKKGLFLFVFLLISQNSIPLFSYAGFTSIYVTKILPYLDIVDILFLALLVKVLVDMGIAGKMCLLNPRIRKYVAGMAILVVFASLWGLYLYGNVTYFVRDMQLFIYLFGMYGIIGCLNLSRRSLHNLVWFIIIGYAGKAILYVFKFVLGMGRPYGAGLRTIFGADPNLMFISFSILVVLLFYALVRRNFDFGRRSTKLILLPGILGFELLFWILNPSRGTWLVLIVLLIITFWNLRMLLTNKVILLASTIGVVLVLVVLLSITKQATLQGIYKHISWEASTLLELKRMTDFDKLNSFSIRAAEFVNIYGQLRANGKLLFGEGLGSWWTDTYIDLSAVLGDPDDPTGSFSAERKRTTHFPLSEFFLKFGIVGSALFWALWGAMLWELRRLFTSTHDSYNSALLLGLTIGSLGLLSRSCLQSSAFLGVIIAVAPMLASATHRQDQ